VKQYKLSDEGIWFVEQDVMADPNCKDYEVRVNEVSGKICV